MSEAREPEKWEYLVHSIDVSGWTNSIDTDLAQGALNRLGDDGWELVQIVTAQTSGSTYQACALLKRRK